jgi:hypothetical protein
MTYLRANGRVSGRVCGLGGRACARIDGSYSLGADEVDITTIGTGPTIKGDATTALIAQVNRFGNSFPLATGTPIPIGPAAAALRILHERLMVAVIRTPDDATLRQLDEVSKAQSDPGRYLQPRLAEVTRQLALYGDTKGLPPAKVGITGGPRMSTTTAALLLGGLAIVAATVLGGKRR